MKLPMQPEAAMLSKVFNDVIPTRSDKKIKCAAFYVVVQLIFGRNWFINQLYNNQEFLKLDLFATPCI